MRVLVENLEWKPSLLEYSLSGLKELFNVCVADADKPKHFGGNTSKFPGGKQPRSEPRRQRALPQQRRENFENSTQNSSKSPGKRGEGNGANENKKTQGEKSEGSVAPLDNTREGKKENGFEESKERTNSTLANSYPGNRRTKRRYVRKTPPEKVNGDQKYFTPANAEDKKSQDENPAREAADKKESTEKNHLKVPQDDQDSVGNGINGVAPLPQRNPGKRKKYYRKNPGTQVKFPPTRENDSLSSAPSRQSSAA